MQTFEIREVGKIREVKKSIAKITGLTQCMVGQLLEITSNARGIIMGFSRGEVIVFLLGKVDEVKVGQTVESQMEPFTIPVGEGFIGRVVNGLGEPLDGKKQDFRASGRSGTDNAFEEDGSRYPIFRPAPTVLMRTPIDEPLETGTLLIDSIIPIGKGQRELIVGDRLTGKTTIGLDAILNQKGKDVVCIYCSIGRSYTSIQKFVEIMKQHGAFSYTMVVLAHAASSSGEQYLCPYTAATLGEYFMRRGRDVLVVFDDMTKHAWAYRQLSLLLERPPGRGAYPGDIFYIHSQLMERAGRYSKEFKGGSMTFLPIVDTIQGDVTGFIPSNLISMTDGQIYLNGGLFQSGIRPAVDVGLSVSRIGSKVQCPAMKTLSADLRLEYLRYNELVQITRFKASVSSDVTQRLRQGEVLTQLFTQESNTPYSLAKQVILLYALHRQILGALTTEEVTRFRDNIFEFVEENAPMVIEEIKEKKDMTPSIREQLDRCFVEFFKKKDKQVI